MILSTLCYLEHDGKWLMLHRVKKDQDPNKGKWIGVGGKLEENESPANCVRREVFEETGLAPRAFSPRGIITFISDKWPTEYMFLYTGESDTEKVAECNEGTLAWIPKESVLSLPLWEGDKYFLKLLCENAPYFEMTLRYEGEKLISSEILQ